MAIARAADIKELLQTGTYPATFSTDHIIDYAQVPKRRFYPSIEVLPRDDSNRYNAKANERTIGFQIKIYYKRLGKMSDEVSDIRDVEDEVERLLRAGNITDNRIILATSEWKREYIDAQGPNYELSTLRFRVVEITPADSSFASDGVLLFKTAESEADNKPLADYQYQLVYDTEISDGYETLTESTVNNNDDGYGVPLRFAGDFGGTFVTNFVIGINDIGSTADKINMLNSVNMNCEKPRICFTSTNIGNSPSDGNVQEVIVVEVDQVRRIYAKDDLVTYQLIGSVVKPAQITFTSTVTEFFNLVKSNTGENIVVTGTLTNILAKV